MGVKKESEIERIKEKKPSLKVWTFNPICKNS